MTREADRAAAPHPSVIWIVANEKAESALQPLLNPHGGVAMCDPGGADEWVGAYRKALRRANVVIVAGLDESERRHAKQVCASLAGIAESIHIVEPAAQLTTAVEHVDAGYGLIDFVEVPR